MKRPALMTVAAVLVPGILFGWYSAVKISSLRQLRSSLQAIPAVTLQETADASTPVLHDTANVTAFIEDVFVLSARHGLRNLVFEQKGMGHRAAGDMPRPAKKPQAARIVPYPVNINFQADYRKAAEFIRELQNRHAASTVERVLMKRGEDGVAVEMTVNLYAQEGG